MRNSFGASWGDGGYFRLGYGEIGIEDPTSTYAVSFTRESLSLRQLPQAQVAWSHLSSFLIAPTWTRTLLLPLTCSQLGDKDLQTDGRAARTRWLPHCGGAGRGHAVQHRVQDRHQPEAGQCVAAHGLEAYQSCQPCPDAPP